MKDNTEHSKPQRKKSLEEKTTHYRSQTETNFTPRQTSSNLQMGFLYTISSSTLKQNTYNYSFPKGDRFIQIKPVSLYEDTNITLKTTLASKSCTFGKGNRKIFPWHTLRNAKNFPSPDRYSVQKNIRHKGGKSFGISGEYYKKVYQPSELLNIELSKELPPMGAYETRGTPGQDKLMYSLYGKGAGYLDNLHTHSPACSTYTPKFKTQTNNKFIETTFGKGWKFDFTKTPTVKYPGPGTYALPSNFDKFDKQTKEQLQQQLMRRVKSSGSQKMFQL